MNNSNIRSVCKEHSPKPNPEYFEKPMTWFVGKYCKLAFPTKLPEGQPQFEHMWVQVTEYCGDELVGLLNNDPICVKDYKFGDLLAFKRTEISQVIGEANDNNP